MQNPFDQFDTQPQSPAQPRIIVPAQPAPKDPADEARQAEQLRLAQEAAARQAASSAREQTKFNRDQQALDARGGVDTTVDERTSGFLGGKLAYDLNSLNGVLKKYPGAASPTFTQKAAGTLGDDAKNLASDAGRQQVEAIQLGILESALTLATGAAYNKEQLVGQQRRYFPQLGDAPETIAEKQKALRFLLEAAKIKAGAAAPQIDQALSTFGQSEPTLPKDEYGFDPQEQAAFDKLAPDQKEAWKRGELYVPGLPLTAQVGSGTDNPPPNGGGDIVIGDGMRKFLVGTGDVVQAAGDAVGLVANPLNAGLNMTGIPQAITGQPLGTDFGQSLRDTLGFPRPQGNTEELISKIDRGAAMGLGMAGAARAAAPMVGGVVSNALSRFGAQPLVDTVAGGSGGGSGELARQNGAGPLGQLGASLLGGGLVVAPAARANAFLEGAPAVENALVRAGKQEGVTVNRAMIDPATEGKVTGVESTVAGGPVVRAGMNSVRGQIEGRVGDLGRGGTPLTENVAGQRVQGAAERYIKDTGKQFRALYNRAEQLAGGVKLASPNANRVLDEVTTRLSETGKTNKAELAYLAELKDDLSKPISVGALRDMRTTLRQKISKGELTFGANEQRVLDVMDALSQDIEGGLRAADKGRAADAFKNADAGYRERMAFIQGTVQKIIGKRNANLPAGQVFQNFQNMAAPKGDLAGFVKMLRSMGPEEQADIAATFADALGKNKAGDFSTAQFITQVGQLPRAARVNLFGPEGAKSIDNLLLLAKEHKRVVGAFNASKTGRTNDYRSWLTNLLLGGGGGASISALTDGSVTVPALAGAAATTLAKGTRDILNARTLLSPDIAKWAANAPKTAEASAINRHFDQLGKIAARNPGLKEEVAQIQQAIMRAANENAATAAASPSDNEKKQR